ncbi:MAG: O-antigen ligase family protein [Ruminococcus sp.]
MFCTFAFSDSKRKFYQIAFDVYSVLLVINSISVILYPGGITALDTYFLGHDDTLLYWLILYIIFTFMYQQCCKNKKEILLVCTFVSGTSLLILKSISGILCMIIFILFYNIIGKSKKLLISSNIAVLVLNVGIVIFKIQKIFSFFIVNILHKSIDLTGREKIWNRVLYWVMQKPIMGYGYETSEILQRSLCLRTVRIFILHIVIISCYKLHIQWEE